MNTIFTKHAINRLHNQGITQSDAWYVFQHPDGNLPGKTPGARKLFKNYGSQRIEVIAKQNEKGEWIILSCWARQRGNGKPIFRKETILEKAVNKIVSKFLRPPRK